MTANRHLTRREALTLVSGRLAQGEHCILSALLLAEYAGFDLRLCAEIAAVAAARCDIRRIVMGELVPSDVPESGGEGQA